MERRPTAEGNAGQATVTGTQGPEAASSGLFRVREAAKRDPKLQFTNLLHHVDVELLRQTYYSLKRDAAAGVDGMTWREYGKDWKNVLPDCMSASRAKAIGHNRVRGFGYPSAKTSND